MWIRHQWMCNWRKVTEHGRHDERGLQHEIVIILMISHVRHRQSLITVAQRWNAPWGTPDERAVVADQWQWGRSTLYCTIIWLYFRLTPRLLWDFQVDQETWVNRRFSLLPPAKHRAHTHTRAVFVLYYYAAAHWTNYFRTDVAYTGPIINEKERTCCCYCVNSCSGCTKMRWTLRGNYRQQEPI